MRQTKLPNLNEFEASQCVDTTRGIGTGGMSIVFSKNGKRISFSKSIMESLSHPDTIQLAYADDVIAISKHLGDEHTNYRLSKSGKMSVIYNSALVLEVVDRYGLDYGNRTSITFPVIVTEENPESEIVYFNMNSTGSANCEPVKEATTAKVKETDETKKDGV